jgi:HAMP domain-containing protein
MLAHLFVKQPQRCNVFAAVWVERGLDSRFPIRSNLALKKLYLFLPQITGVVSDFCYWVRIL